MKTYAPLYMGRGILKNFSVSILLLKTSYCEQSKLIQFLFKQFVHYFPMVHHYNYCLMNFLGHFPSKFYVCMVSVSMRMKKQKKKKEKIIHKILLNPTFFVKRLKLATRKELEKNQFSIRFILVAC